MSSLWQRYFLKELIKVFGLFIGCFYFLYVLMDYSAHTKDFQSVSLFHIVTYYACQFTKRGDILVTIALLIATIKVLTTSNLRHEIVALVTGGIPLKTILRPFLWAACGCALLLYINFQFLQPYCLNRIVAFEDRIFKSQTKGGDSKKVSSIVLEDNTLLIYQHYDPSNQAFFDVYWLKDHDHIFRIQSLLPYEKVPLGKYVDALTRSSNGELIKTASYDACTFPQIRFDSKALFTAVHPPRMQAISQLAPTITWKQLGLKKMTDREAEASTFFFLKLTTPLFCLLAVLAPAPYCLRFTRSLPVFLIYALSLFGMIAFYALVNSCVILGESQVIPPILAILLPQTVFVLVLVRYAKL